MPFNGTPAPGGARPGSGRKTDKFKAKIAKIGDPAKIIQFYWDVANGKVDDVVMTESGEQRIGAGLKDRLKASELFLDRVIGKVPTKIDPEGFDGIPFVGFLVNSEKERGLQ